MASRCGLSVATTHRLLTTLAGVGAVIHVAPGKYRIGTALFRLTDTMSIERLYAAAAEQSLRRMCKNLCTAAHLGVLDQDQMVTYLAKASRRSQFPPTVIGSKLEAYCSGLGKVLLAALPEKSQQLYLEEGPFIALTARTITKPESLAKELRLVAKRGYAVDDCELFDDLRCVAVPIKDSGGQVVAALSASSPASQIPLNKIPELAAELMRRAREISDRLYPSAIPAKSPQ
ncbi:MAG: hypothetical protein RL317_1032 [Pseudomonadota bacterium]|jgi:DNA-binding IclR family transcriptional regulator